LVFLYYSCFSSCRFLEKNIVDSLDGMDKNTIYLFKYSFGPTDVEQWKRDQFPNVKYDEFQYLQKNIDDIDKISFNFFTNNQSIKYDENTVNSIRVKPSTNEFFEIEPFKVEKGRLFNEAESNSGTPVIVIGSEVSEGLFKGNEPIGKQIRLYGQRYTVIGVLKKMGQNTFGDSNDVAVFYR